MKACSVIPIYLLLPLLLGSCGSHVIKGNGVAKTEARALSSASFSRIEIDAPVDAHITIGGTPSLELKGPSNVLPYVRTEIRNNTLHIFTDDQTDLDTRSNISAIISLPTLKGLEVSGAGNHDVAGAVRSDEFSLESSGACKVNIADLQVRSLDADLSGAAILTIGSGLVEHASYEISGSGDIHAFGVTHHTARFDLSGAGSAELTVTGNLDAEISGAGSIKYKGHPQIKKDVSGVGSVVDAN